MREGPIPLMIGVVGHRSLPAATEELKRVVRSVLRSYRTQVPSTRLVLLSALAGEGDRLVAIEALASGFDLIVPLPVTADEYEAGLPTSAARSEFRDLVARADSSFVVPSGDGESGNPHDLGDARCGVYIARHCTELIALWDGESREKGRTASIVRYQLEGVTDPDIVNGLKFDPVRCGPVLHILTPRSGASNTEHAYTVVSHFPRSVSDPEKCFASVKSDIDRFNRDATLGSIATRTIGLPVRKQAQVLANAYQLRTVTAQVAISSFAFLSIVAFNVYATFGGRSLQMLIVYLLLTAAAFAFYVIYKRGQWQLRYQDYRTIELLLTVDHFWRLAGIRKSVASRFARSERMKVDWIPIAVRSITPERQIETGFYEPSDAIQRVYEEWVIPQHQYFSQAAGRRERWRDRASARTVTALVILSISATIGSHVGFSLGLLHSVIGPLFFAALFAVAAALIHDFADKRGWGEHARYYELMAALFGAAAARMGELLRTKPLKSNELRQAQAILITLGDEAIRENASWINLHRSRPLNVPHI